MNQKSQSPTWHSVTLAEAPHTPWKNGGGTKQDLLHLANTQDGSLRISVARIERSGDFSSFPGVQRWFAVLSGDAIELKVDDALHCLNTHSEPLCFDGALPVHAQLLGSATQDLNFMLRGSARAGRMRRVRAGESIALLNTTNFVANYVINTTANDIFGIFGTETVVLPAQTLVWRHAANLGGQACVFEGGDVLLMEAQL